MVISQKLLKNLNKKAPFRDAVHTSKVKLNFNLSANLTSRNNQTQYCILNYNSRARTKLSIKL